MTGHILCEDLTSDNIDIDMLNRKAEICFEILSHAYWGMMMKHPRKIFLLLLLCPFAHDWETVPPF